MRRPSLFAVLLPCALLAALAAPSPVAAEVPAAPLKGCPDRSAATLAAISGPGCNVWVGDLLYSLAFGLHADPLEIAVVDAAESFVADPHEGDTFLSPVTVGTRRCVVAVAAVPGEERSGLPAAGTATVRRTISLADFAGSDCRPTPGTWQHQVDHYPDLVAMMTAVVLQFDGLAAELSDLERDQRRLFGIFGALTPQDRAEGGALRAINRPRELSRLALGLAAGSRSFLASVRATLKDTRSDGAEPWVSTWAAGVRRQLPTDKELAALDLDSRISTLALALAAVRPGTRR